MTLYYSFCKPPNMSIHSSVKHVLVKSSVLYRESVRALYRECVRALYRECVRALYRESGRALYRDNGANGGHRPSLCNSTQATSVEQWALLIRMLTLHSTQFNNPYKCVNFHLCLCASVCKCMPTFDMCDVQICGWGCEREGEHETISCWVHAVPLSPSFSLHRFPSICSLYLTLWSFREAFCTSVQHIKSWMMQRTQKEKSRCP